MKDICSILDHEIPLKNQKLYSDQIIFVKDRPGHDFRYAIDAKKIENELGWKPKESFKTGIKKTISWYLNNRNWWENIQKNTYQQKRLGVLK